MVFRTDCEHYLGYKPCVKARLCDGCTEYAPSGISVLIIKTAATGDVLRTTSLLPALKRTIPGVRIEWLTAPYAAPLLANNPHIDRVIPFDAEAWPALLPRMFEMIFCLDKEPGAAGVATLLNAQEKRGILLSGHGTPYPANAAAEHYFSIGLSNEIKFKQNKDSYHKLAAEALGFQYCGEKPELNLTEDELRRGRDILRIAGWDGARPLIGINTGAGGTFANKMLSSARIVELIDMLAAEGKDAHIVLLGGPGEEEKNRGIEHAAAGRARDAGCRHPLREFAAAVAHLDVMLTGDTLAMHMAVAAGRRCVVLFGPTCEQEIDLFGKGRKIISSIDCAPCYRKECATTPNCMDAFDLDGIANAVLSELSAK